MPFAAGILELKRYMVSCTGAGEDVESVLARLQAQAAENALLRDRQAKASSDLQVYPMHRRNRRAAPFGVNLGKPLAISSFYTLSFPS